MITVLDLLKSIAQGDREQTTFVVSVCEETCPICSKPFGEHPTGKDLKPTGFPRRDAVHAVAVLEWSVSCLDRIPGGLTPQGQRGREMIARSSELIREIAFPRTSAER